MHTRREGSRGKDLDVRDPFCKKMVLLGGLLSLVLLVAGCLRANAEESFDATINDRERVMSFTMNYIEVDRIDEGLFDTSREDIAESLEREVISEAEPDKAEKKQGSGILERLKDMADFSTIIKTSYTDNVYYSSNNEVEDFTTSVIQGIKLRPRRNPVGKGNSARRKFNWSVETGLEVKRWLDQVDNDRENPFLTAQMSFPIGSKAGFQGFFDYSKNQSITSLIDEQLTKGSLVDYDEYQSVGTLLFNFNKLDLELTLSAGERLYGEDPFKTTNSFLTTKAIVRSYWRIASKTRLFLEYDLGSTNYVNRDNDSGDLDQTVYWIGVDGRITSKITGRVKAGFQETEYQDSSSNNSSETLYADLTYKMHDNISLKLEALRKTVSARVTSESTSDYNSFSLICDYFPRFNKKMALQGKVQYILNEYQSGREDEYYRWGVGMKYLLKKWLKVEAGCNILTKESTAANLSYDKADFYLQALLEY